MPAEPAPSEVPPIDLTGRTLGDFQVLRKLGQGGMGQVYLARQLSLKREIALKILRNELSENVTALKRFQAEAEAIARISHPNIVQVFAIGESEGIRYMALEYVEGRNLRDFLERKGPPELPVTLAIMRQVAAALQRANELGLVHRDIKPENILLNRKVEVKVADFGLSRYFAGEGKPNSITQSGMTLGTPLYMSPEQVQGKPVDHRCDLYSFGVTCYHLLAGEPPYRGANAFDVAVQHVQSQPEPLENLRPDLPPDLLALVRKLMEKKVEDRYQSAKEVLRDLVKIQKGIASGLANSTTVSSTNTTQQGPMNLQVTLSGSTVGGVNLVPATSGQSIPVPLLVPDGNRWPWRILGMLALAAVVFLGWFLYGLLHPLPVEQGVAAQQGLPDERIPRVVSAHEQQLKELFKNKQPSPEHTKIGVKLGLLYLNDRRWDEAEALFKELEAIRYPVIKGNTDIPFPAAVVGKLGLAIVLAHQDKPKESVELFQSAESQLRQQRPFIPRSEIERFFFMNMEFGQAVAEALNRINAAQKLPNQLEWLRTPSGIMRGPK